jgi:hypothetical protein
MVVASLVTGQLRSSGDRQLSLGCVVAYSWITREHSVSQRDL